MTPVRGRAYLVELCSGERQRWRFLGADGGEFAWWRDEETGATFSEAVLMYAWRIVGPVEEESRGEP